MGVKVGTNKIDAIIVDKTGKVIGFGSSNLKSYYSLRPGYAEQDPRDWEIKVFDAIRSATKSLEESDNKLVALGITTQRRTFVPMDEHGKHLRSAILWFDTRTYDSMDYRIRWIRKNEPDVYNKTYKFMGVQGWLAYKLTNKWVDSKAAQFASEFQTEDSWEWNDSVLSEAGLSVEQFPKLHYPGKIMGTVIDKIAKKTGLPLDLPVVAGAGNIQSATIGSGCFGREKLMINYGTSLTLGSTSRIKPEYPLMSEFSSIPNAYDAQLGIAGGFWMSKWFIEQFVLPGETDDLSIEKSLEIMNKEAAQISPGSEGLVVLPHWWGGRWQQHEPHIEDRGAIIGWTRNHTRAHLFRAIIEGLLMEMRQFRDLMEQHLETTFSDIRIVGGGSDSNLVAQMTADITGSQVSRIQTSAAFALGAAMVAAKGAGLYETVEDAVRNMAHITKTFTPNLSNTELYDRLYRRVYVKLYWAMKELNSSIYSLGI
ncbi:MAG: FGGY-family carbohydrate kinase [Candidatus Thorarchaeota archaeon]